MKKIKFSLVGISILFASLAWSATSYACMMGGMHHGPNGHHGGYEGYDDHHGGNEHDPGPGRGVGDDSRSMDEHHDDAGAGHGPDHGDAFDDAPAGSGQRHQAP